MSTRRGSTEVHEFDGMFLGFPVHYKVTSVIGHVFRYPLSMALCALQDIILPSSKRCHSESSLKVQLINLKQDFSLEISSLRFESLKMI